jgi:hypothetical protein
VSHAPLLPRDWRRRRGMEPRSARFTIEGERGEWMLIDWAYGNTVGFARKADAQDAHWFAREYVKEHGDIDFSTFPYELEEPLVYDDVERVRRWWSVEYPA